MIDFVKNKNANILNQFAVHLGLCFQAFTAEKLKLVVFTWNATLDGSIGSSTKYRQHMLFNMMTHTMSNVVQRVYSPP